MARIRHPKDFIAGLIFIAFGVTAIVVGSNYTLGTAARMGPGYFPRVLGTLLILLGGALSVRSLWLQGSPLPSWKWRPTLVVLGSVVLFGLCIAPPRVFGVALPSLGLVLSTVILIMLSSSASTEFRPREAMVSSVLLAALAVGVFVIGLKLQLPIWPGQG